MSEINTNNWNITYTSSSTNCLKVRQLTFPSLKKYDTNLGYYFTNLDGTRTVFSSFYSIYVTEGSDLKELSAEELRYLAMKYISLKANVDIHNAKIQTFKINE